MKVSYSTKLISVLTFAVSLAVTVSQAQQKPNIIIPWGDDNRISSISAYGDGLMGYTTPNIDRMRAFVFCIL